MASGKRLLAICVFLCCAALLLVAFTSCVQKTDEQDETTASSNQGTEPVVSASLSDYAIVYPQGTTNAQLIEAIGAFKDAVAEQFGCQLDLHDDSVRPTDGAGEYEILIGSTNRQESGTVLSSILKINDYEIRLYGKKIVITAHNPETLVLALGSLTAKIAGMTDQSEFLSTSINERYGAKYTVSDLILNGFPLGEYDVLYASDNALCRTLANELRKAVVARSGYLLSVRAADGTIPEGKHILIGNVGAAGGENTGGGSRETYSVKMESGCLVLTGTTDAAICRAADVMIASVNATVDPNPTISPRIGSFAYSPLVVMSFNLLYNQRSEERDANVIDTIRRNAPDTFGVQEATPEWISTLTEALGEDYGYVGEGKYGGNSGEYSAVFYRKDRFTLIESGTFWLSTTPNKKGSVMTGASSPRVCTYAVLELKKTGQRFLHVNTHPDHVPNTSVDGTALRLKQVQVITTFLKEHYPDLPVILTGDLNEDANKAAVQHLISFGLDNSSKVALESDTTPTYNDRVIDYAMFSHGDFRVYRYSVDTTKYSAGYDGMYASDHRAIVVQYDLLP